MPENSLFLTHAQYLISIGLCPVLLNGKKPIFHNYNEYLAGPAGSDELTLHPEKRPLRYSFELLQAWAREYPFANLGLLTRERPSIDVDAPHIWEAIRDLVPFTPHVKRGARGFTLIYSQDASNPVLKTRTFTNRFSREMVLEVLAQGRQTVLPPSVHPDSGLPYEWIALPDLGVMCPQPLTHLAPPTLSQAVVDAIEARLAALGITKARVERGTGLARGLADGERRRFEAYLLPKLAEKVAAVRAAASGGRQDALNGACFALAPWVREGFVDEVWLEAEMRDACWQNGWIADDGDKAFTRQFTKAIDDGWNGELPDLEAGRAAALMGAAPLQLTSPVAASSQPPGFWTYDGTLPEDEPELIRRLLPATAGNIAFVAGQSGMGKSFYVSAMAVALGMGQGTLFFGQPVRERVGVIIIAAEGAGGMRARLFAAARAMGATGRLPIAVIARCGNLCIEADRLAILEALEAARLHLWQEYGVRVGVVVIDTMLAAFGMEDEGASAEAQKICGYMRQLGEHVGAVVVPVHHVGKDGSQGMRGSSAYYAAADHVVVCGGTHDHKTGITDNRYLAIDKSRNDGTGPVSNTDLKIVDLGFNRYGEQRTTCVYVTRDGDVDPDAGKKERTHGHGIVIFDDAFNLCVTRNGGDATAGVVEAELRMQFNLMCPGSGSTKRMAWKRTSEKLQATKAYRFMGDLWFRETMGVTFGRHTGVTGASHANL